MTTRRDILKSLGVTMAGLTLPRIDAGIAGKDQRALSRSKKKKPNILIILVDDLGFGDLSCQGAPDLRTPHIDNLAAGGMRFDNFYANCPVCSPTRAALLTGRYPDLVGVPGVIRTFPEDNFGYLHPGATLLSTVLKEAGYDTALIGKWHLGLESPNTPPERDFDHFYGFLGDMMDDYNSHRRAGFNYMRYNREEIDPEGHATDLFTQAAVDYIRGRRSGEKPFFLLLSYNAPHTPIQPPQAWLVRARDRNKDSDETRTKLVALIEHLDDGIGQVSAALRDGGLEHDTLVIFTSDNGGQLNVGGRNGALRGGKGMMFEGGIRVPLFAVWSGIISPGTRNPGLGMTMDLYATVCEAAGAEFSQRIEGRSLWPALHREPIAEENRTVFWVRREGGSFGGRAIYAARQGRFKLLQNSPYEPLALFDLADDPMEQSPLPADHPMYRILFTALRNHILMAGSVPWQKQVSER